MVITCSMDLYSDCRWVTGPAVVKSELGMIGYDIVIYILQQKREGDSQDSRAL